MRLLVGRGGHVLMVAALCFAGIGVAPAPPAVAAAGLQRSMVFVSSHSSKVTVMIGGLRKDITLQPTEQVIPLDIDETDQPSSRGAAFLYNPGSGKDGVLR